MNANTSPLGQKTEYKKSYSPQLLYPIPRQIKRDEIKVPSKLPFYGVDFWNGYELSWLDNLGKPVVAIAQFTIPCTSDNIIESKSFKLYLNSFNQSKFESFEKVKSHLIADLSNVVGEPIEAGLFTLDNSPFAIESLTGICLDTLPVSCDTYTVNPDFLSQEDEMVDETLYSHLLKSNCLVTNQPDWGSVQIKYKGNRISHEGLLQYIVSFREHNEFHEQCVERIFMDILRNCNVQELTVMARYTRRGGLDINPIRTTRQNFTFVNTRLVRQ